MNLRYDNWPRVSHISPLVLVGVCAAGKSTVSRLLRDRGIEARPVAQEHSRVPDLYKRSGEWAVLLVANWQSVHRRRQLSWDLDFYRVEWDRLSVARRDAKLIVHTDWLLPEQVADYIMDWFDRYTGLDRLWDQHPDWPHDQKVAIRGKVGHDGPDQWFDSLFKPGL